MTRYFASWFYDAFLFNASYSIKYNFISSSRITKSELNVNICTSDKKNYKKIDKSYQFNFSFKFQNKHLVGKQILHCALCFTGKLANWSVNNCSSEKIQIKCQPALFSFSLFKCIRRTHTNTHILRAQTMSTFALQFSVSSLTMALWQIDYMMPDE